MVLTPNKVVALQVIDQALTVVLSKVTQIALQALLIAAQLQINQLQVTQLLIKRIQVSQIQARKIQVKRINLSLIQRLSHLSRLTVKAP